MTDTASRLTHLSYRQFLSHFCTHFLQSKPWRIIPLKFECRRHLTTMLQSQRSPMDSCIHNSRKTPTPGANDGASAAGCTSPLTLKASKTQFLSSRFLSISSVLDFCMCKGNLSRSYRLRNTSAPSIKYFHCGGRRPPPQPRGKLDFRLGLQMAFYQK